MRRVCCLRKGKEGGRSAAKVRTPDPSFRQRRLNRSREYIHMAYRYYNVRIVGLPEATCANILRCTGLHVVRRLDPCLYRIRTARFYEPEVQEIIEECARGEGYMTTIIEVDSRRPAAVFG